MRGFRDCHIMSGVDAPALAMKDDDFGEICAHTDRIAHRVRAPRRVPLSREQEPRLMREHRQFVS